MNLQNKQVWLLEPLEPRFLLGGMSLMVEPLEWAQPLDVPGAGSVTVTDSICAAGETDMYKVTVPATGRLFIDMRAADEGIDPYLELFFGSRRLRLVRRNDNATRWTRDSRIFLRVRQGWTFYVRAGGKDTTGDYELTVESSPWDDYGNTFESARKGRLNRWGAGRMVGTINYAQDVDLLEIVATRTGTMCVDMRTFRISNLTCELSAYDAEGHMLAHDGGSDGEAPALRFDVVGGCTYYIEAGGADSTTGRYFIKMTTQDRPAPPPEPPKAEPEPGSVIAAEIRSLPGGLELLVLGTNGNDTITLSQTPRYVALQTGASTRLLAGSFSSISVYGFSGNDTIRLTYTVTAGSRIYAGGGNDVIFEAGSGTAVVYGAEGDDLLVTVGGGQDALNGQAGSDSFWFDASDSVSDASAAETTAGAVHRIAEFYQPYTTNKASRFYVPLQIAGQNFADPLPTLGVVGYHNFASKPLFVGGPEYDDVVQGAVGDCYYLAALSSLALTDAGIIQQMIAPMGDGTFAVRFHRNGKEVYLRVDADLPITRSGSPAYAGFGPDGELWVPLVEKAYAYFRYGQNSYASLSGGWMGSVYEEVTNRAASWRYSYGDPTRLYNFIAGSLAAGHAVTMGSFVNAPVPIVGSHAYVVKSAHTEAHGSFVTLYNPWGIDGRRWDSNPYDGLLTLSIEQVQDCFLALAVSSA